MTGAEPGGIAARDTPQAADTSAPPPSGAVPVAELNRSSFRGSCLPPSHRSGWGW